MREPVIVADSSPLITRLKIEELDLSNAEMASSGYAKHARGDYGYDLKSGNITYDPSRDLTMIYNHLNLPHTFELGNGQIIKTVYDSDGQKRQEKTLVPGQNGGEDEIVKQRDYLGPTQYLDGSLETVFHDDGRVVPGEACEGDIVISHTVDDTEVHLANSIVATATVLLTGDLTAKAKQGVNLQAGFSVEEGAQLFVGPASCSGPNNGWRFEYFLKDHLGNNRILFADLEGDGKLNSLDVLQELHYYPFGMEMEGEWTDANANSSSNSASTENRYKYNGKELNPELGLYDYGARWYDPTIARFTTIDPLASEMPEWSPYNYTFNNPIKFIDPDGNNPILALRAVMVASRATRATRAVTTASRATRTTRTATSVGRATKVLQTEAAAISHDWNTLTGASSSFGERAGALSDLVLGTWFNEADDAAATTNTNTEDGTGRADVDGYAPDRALPRTEHGETKVDEEAQGSAHTQLGAKEGREGKYRQAREFDAEGNPVRDIDFTDHGRPNQHTNPHQHPYEPTGGTPRRGKAEPLNPNGN